jgi:hypothetical protein
LKTTTAGEAVLKPGVASVPSGVLVFSTEAELSFKGNIIRTDIWQKRYGDGKLKLQTVLTSRWQPDGVLAIFNSREECSLISVVTGHT